MLEVKALAAARGGRCVFKSLALSAGAGELIEISGANGSGKSTLLRVLAGLLAPAEGSIEWRGASLDEAIDDYRGASAFLGHLNGLKDELTVEENLCFDAAARGRPAGDEELRRALRALGLEALRTRPCRRLSQGQRRRVALARLPLAAASLWLLDEPIAALDDPSVERFAQLLTAHLAAGGAALVATHQPLRVTPARRVHLAAVDS